MSVARFASVRLDLKLFLDKNDTQSLEETCVEAQNHIQALETSVIQGQFLQATYSVS